MRGTILIVEDQPNFREGLKYYLEQEALGWKVVGTAETGLEGWELIGRLKPELVFMDINMPVMNGIELARLIHEHQLDTLFVIITGYQDFSYAQSAVRYGALDFLLKPCSNDEINRILRIAFEKLAEQRLYKESLRAAKENRLRSALLYRQTDEQQATWLKRGYEGKRLYLLAVDNYFPPEKNYKGKDMYLLQYGITNIVEEMMKSLPQRSAKERLGEQALKGQAAAERKAAERLEACEASEAERGLVERSAACEPEVECSSVERSAACEPGAEWHLLRHDQLVLALDCGVAANQWIDGIIRAVDDCFGIRLNSFFLGGCDDIHRLLQAYEKGAGQSILLSEPAGQDGRHLTGRFRNDIMAIIVDGDIESLPAYFVEYYESLKEMPLAQLRLTGIAHAQALNDVSEALFTKAELPSILQTMEQIRDLHNADQIREWLRRRSADFLDELFEWRDMVNGSVNVIQKALRFIKLHYKEECSISRTAEHVHMNTSYFSTLFKKETGVTYSHYVNQLRLEQAKVLLRNTNMKMIDIAQAVGINDSAYFSILFKKHFCISPSEFRQQAMS